MPHEIFLFVENPPPWHRSMYGFSLKNVYAWALKAKRTLEKDPLSAEKHHGFKVLLWLVRPPGENRGLSVGVRVERSDYVNDQGR